MDDSEDFGLPKLVFAVIAALLVIAAVGSFIVEDSAPSETADASMLAVNTSNAAAMHRYGMPTKEDVMEWHVTGQWGYKAGSNYFVYADLPGDKQAWDDLYGIENNPTFDK